MKIDLPFIYSQWDSRWANLILGFNASNSGFNFYNYACLITCQAMVARYYKKNYDPIQINDAYKSMGAGKGFSANSGNYVPGGFHLLFGDIEEKLTVTPSTLTDAQINEIKSAIDAGFPVMVQLDYNPKDVDLDSHFVLITGYNPNEENDFTIADPLGGKEVSLKTYLGWFKPNARNTIERYYIYKGSVPKASAKDVIVPGDIYPNIVHGSTEWDETVNEYKPGSDPKQTQFEDVRNVINGYKSRATDLEGQLTLAKAELVNKVEELARKELERQESEKLRLDLVSKLNDALKGSANVVGVYEAQLKAKQGVIDEQGKTIGNLKKDNAQCQTDLKKAKDTVASKLSVSKLLTLLKQALLKK